MEEQELIKKCQSGDVKSFEPLFRTHLQMAVRTAYLIVRDWSIAEDAAQEAFVRAFGSIRSFRAGKPFAPWLYRIVVNEARRLAAKGKRMSMTEDTDKMLVPKTETLEEVAIGQERRLMLWEALHTLTEEHRAVLVLKYFNDFTEADIATVLRIPQSTVKSRLYAARQRLAVRLDKWREVIL